jgi:hypothetical protein
MKTKGAADTVGRARRFRVPGTKPYLRRLPPVTDKYTGLYSSVSGIFLGFGTEEYSSVIFLGTEEYKKPEEDTLFSCSAPHILLYRC